ncbi:MAG: hypothetical protein UX24_C0006G0012 [Candidatus Giovannonibacteria bacterium GW2011_GWB1_45_9b]|uniref:Uncharacterized protein n=6 Tax=Candidatus Giovannoniibacteriota TaxID=1752738 RepID=A0A1F5X0U7_9BACT|nr:MAG: hypothetical protein UW74_C0025G0012 [Candidatus Giovannonibacteria bacterium GW2011_GWC2_44_8]KKU16599.1 MAG: hypothetical protein UX24_C0006G0012 [Candidatus Giovannonibacteria bacterium GW2011_GWB1_45_9b]OGF73731.1 MAG: hypothetical protein A2W57_03890 [Candidatus Giovannonibacteria bacterium RIFCSPHIGHO2_02_43_16]OGF81514.1 MAG: hypothetical protein A2W48_01755 [Candidatus Giovannonibacteria bacterium RIFCSPHIGHO2_12_44_12]OGF84130.1 MAG: hypothetical protein A2Z63_02985 [Candidatus
MSQKIKIKKGMTGQDIQDELFRRMSASEKIKLAFDFSAVGRELGLAEGTLIPNSYLIQWMKWNRIKYWQRFYIKLQNAFRDERIKKFKMSQNTPHR